MKNKQFVTPYLHLPSETSSFVAPVQFVKEIISTPALTNLPFVKDFLAGVINFKGIITPVIDLEALTNSSAPKRREFTVILSLGKIDLGLMIDSACQMINMEGFQTLSTTDTIQEDFIKSIIRYEGLTYKELDVELIFQLSPHLEPEV